MVLPGAIPDTIPEEFTVATDVLLLLHAPPAVPSELRAIKDPAHTDDGPLIVPAVAAAFTFIIVCALGLPQPFTVYVMITLPGATPLTTPEDVTVAIAGLLLLQAPPGVPLLLKLMDEPAHTDEGPLIVPAFAAPFTVTIVMAIGLPQPFTW